VAFISWRGWRWRYIVALDKTWRRGAAASWRPEAAQKNEEQHERCMPAKTKQAAWRVGVKRHNATGISAALMGVWWRVRATKNI